METPSKFDMELKIKVSLINENVDPIFNGCNVDHRWKKGSIVSPGSQLCMRTMNVLSHQEKFQEV